MSSHYRWMATSVLAGVLVMAAAVAAQVDEEGRFRPGAEWPVAGGDWTNARYSTLSQLNTTTVKSLGAAWMSKRFDNGAASRATPIVKDGLMFVTAGSGVYALNAKTGEKVWAWQSGASEDATRLAETLSLVAALNAGHAFPSPAGVAVGEGLVFVGLMDGHVVALRQKTGQLVWSQQTGQEDPPKKGQAVSGPPTYARGLVFAGLANGDWGLRGRVVALDAKTGRQVWRFLWCPVPARRDMRPGRTTAMYGNWAEVACGSSVRWTPTWEWCTSSPATPFPKLGGKYGRETISLRRASSRSI